MQFILVVEFEVVLERIQNFFKLFFRPLSVVVHYRKHVRLVIAYRELQRQQVNVDAIQTIGFRIHCGILCRPQLFHHRAELLDLINTMDFEVALLACLHRSDLERHLATAEYRQQISREVPEKITGVLDGLRVQQGRQ